MARREIAGNWTRDDRNAMNNNFKELYEGFSGVVEEVSESAFNKVIDASKLNWHEPVQSQSSLPSVAEEGDTRMTRDTGKVYRFNGDEWKEIQQISAGPVNEVDNRLNKKIDDGLNSVNQQLAQKAEQRDLESFEGRLADIITTPAGTISEQEIIDARDTEPSLGMNIRKIDNKLKIKDNAPTLELTGEFSNLTLDSIAYRELSFSDIFIERNAINNSHFNNDLGGFSIGHGSPVISSDAYYTPNKSLKVFGTSSQYITKPLQLAEGKKYFFAAKVKVDRYVTGGGVGFQVNSNAINISANIRAVNNEFETIYRTVDIPSNDLITMVIGAYGGSNADGYIDDVVAVDITDIAMTEEEIIGLYDVYLQIVKGEPPTTTLTRTYKVLTEENIDELEFSATLQDKDANQTIAYDLEKENNELSLSWNKESGSVNLGSIAFDDITYSQLFKDNNFVPNSHFDNGLTGYSVGAGTPSVTSEKYNTPSNSLKIFGTESQYVRINTLPEVGRKYFIAAKVKVDRYTSGGGIGFQIIDTTGGSISKRIREVTSDFVTLSNVFTVTQPLNNIIVGSFGGSNADGYIDDFVMIDITDIDDPANHELERLYETYLRILKGEKTSYPIEKKYKLITQDITSVGDNDAIHAFVEAMNSKAKEIGMKNTHFTNPYGNNDAGHLTTTRDLVKLGVHSVGYNELVKVWNKKSYTIDIKGPRARKEIMESTVTDPALEGDYYIFGGKTGTTTVNNLLVLVNAPNNNWFVGAIMGAPGNRFEAAKNMFDIGALYMDENYSGNHDVEADKAAVALMPNHNPFAYEQYDLPLLWGKNEDIQEYPASVTKVMTCVVALDYLSDPNEQIEIKASDIFGGSGPTFYEGDIVTVKDALYGMMLPSSNTLATAAARVAGTKIIRG